ncbi:hypothetical protein AVEN_76856-1, partial [Araneus ventricosus]
MLHATQIRPSRTQIDSECERKVRIDLSWSGRLDIQSWSFTTAPRRKRPSVLKAGQNCSVLKQKVGFSKLVGPLLQLHAKTDHQC